MAVIAVSGHPVVGIKYTHTTASSADWSSVSNSTYFYDLTDKLVHFKDASGIIQDVFPNVTQYTLTDTTPITIPTAVGVVGVIVRITYRNFSGGNVLFTSTSSQEIGNLITGNPTTFTLYDGEILCLESNNTKWLIV